MCFLSEQPSNIRSIDSTITIIDINITNISLQYIQTSWAQPYGISSRQTKNEKLNEIIYRKGKKMLIFWIEFDVSERRIR